jgi:hypothetical protein
MIDTIDIASVERRGSTGTASTADLAALGIARFATPHRGRSGEVPWRVVSHEKALELHVVRLREEALADAANAPVLMGCGGALENMRLALSHAGFAGDVTLFPNVDDDVLIATLRAGVPRDAAREEEALFAAIADQGAGRHGLNSTPPRPTPALLALLHHAARTRGCWIDVIADDCRRAMLADCVSRATTLTDAVRGSRPLFSLFASDTVPSRTLGTHDLLGLEHVFASLGAWVRPSPPRTRLARVWQGANVMEAPVVMVLGSSGDTPKDWVYAGAALQRVLLHATAQHMAATFFAEPMQHPLVRDQLRQILFAGGHPHAIVRLDFADTIT